MDPTPTYAADGAVYAFLRDRFYYAQIDYVQASVATTASANGYDLLVISSTPGSEHIRDKWDTSRTGILNWEQAVADDDGNEFMMADSLIPVTANQAILAADVGDRLRDGSLSPNRRVMFSMDDGTFSAISADGLRLFGQAAQWAGDTEKPVLLRYTFPTTAAAETGPGFGPTTVAPLLDASYEMAVKDTAGNITLEISNPGGQLCHSRASGRSQREFREPRRGGCQRQVF